MAYLKGNSKIKEKFFQENSYTNKKNVFFGPKIGGRLIHGIDLYTGKYGRSDINVLVKPLEFYLNVENAVHHRPNAWVRC